MGVNFTCFFQFYVRGQPGEKRHLWKDAVIPLAGFLFCLWIWCNLSKPSLIRGGICMAAALLYAAVKTRGFRGRALTMDFRES